MYADVSTQARTPAEELSSPPAESSTKLIADPMVTKGHVHAAYVLTSAAGVRRIYIRVGGGGSGDEVVPISRGRDAAVRTSADKSSGVPRTNVSNTGLSVEGGTPEAALLHACGNRGSNQAARTRVAVRFDILGGQARHWDVKLHVEPLSQQRLVKTVTDDHPPSGHCQRTSYSASKRLPTVS